MKKTLIVLTLAFILISAIVIAAHGYISPYYAPRTRGPERVVNFDPRIQTYRINTVAHLTPIEPQEGGTGQGRGGYYQRFPRGAAKISSSRHQYYPRAMVELSATNLERTDQTDNYYQGWLFDEESGYALSLGVFDTIGISGFGILNYRANMYFDAYDWILITEEPKNDPDPTPGKIVLIGEIPKPRYYEPEPTIQQKIFGYRFGSSAS